MTNRVANGYTGTVHYADTQGRPACGPVKTHPTWMHPTVDTVTCERCRKQYGEDTE